MALPISGLGLADSASTFDNSSSRLYLSRDTPSQLSTQRSRAYSEHSSDISSNSGASFGSRQGRSMNRGGRQRGGRGGRGGNRTYSGSSGSSSGQPGLNRPVLRPTSAPHGHATPPIRVNQGPVRADSPVTPTKEQSSFPMNGHTINETWKPSGSAFSMPPKPSDSSSTPTRSAYGDNTPGHQRTTPKPIAKNGEERWAYNQEYKIKILGIPKAYWTGEVQQAMSLYGNVVRVEVQLASGRDNSAWVSFQ